MQTQQKTVTAPFVAAAEPRPRLSDFDCPDCSALLETQYDQNDNPRYHCENCGLVVLARGLVSGRDSDYDDYEDTNGDNDISIGFSA